MNPMAFQSCPEAQRGRGKASILAIGTATPTNCFYQSDFPDFYFRVTNCDHMTDLKDKFKRICGNSAIRKRHMLLTEEILRNNTNITSKEFKPSLTTRQEMLAREVPVLGAEAAMKAIKEWGRAVSLITHLVFATTSGVESLTADCHLIKILGLRASVSRHFIFQQGCFSGSAALRLAKELAENNPGSRVLVVCSDSTANWFSAPSVSRLGMLIGHAIFSDGASAAVFSADSADERPLFKMVSAAQTLVPGTEDAIVAKLGESRVVYSLSPKLPRYAADGIDKILEEALAGTGAGDDWNSLFYALHPGGRAVLDRVEDKLGLGPQKLWASRHVLGEYGNMWGPTVLFVLDELRRKAVAKRKATTGDGFDWGVLVAFGPGFTIDTIVLRSVTLA